MSSMWPKTTCICGILGDFIDLSVEPVKSDFLRAQLLKKITGQICEELNLFQAQEGAWIGLYE